MYMSRLKIVNFNPKCKILCGAGERVREIRYMLRTLRIAVLSYTLHGHDPWDGGENKPRAQMHVVKKWNK